MDYNDDNFKYVLSNLKQLLYLAKRDNIGSVVSHLIHVKVGVLNPTAIKRCIQWVIEQVHAVEGQQLLFLCATLGYIITFVRQEDCLPSPNDEQTKRAFDKLSQNLAVCAKKNFWVPNNCLQLLDRIAYTLVQGCSKPGWLTFAAYFRPFFGIRYVLDVKMKSCECGRDEYWELLSLLMFSLPSIRKARQEEKRFYHEFLWRILQFSPDDDVLFKVIESKDHVYRFFSSPNDREYFFVDYFKVSLNKRTGSLGDKLKHLIKITAKFPGKLSALIYAYVQQFIQDTAAVPSSDDMDTVLRLISENFSDDKVLFLLRDLSKSSLATHHDLFLQLLIDERFARKWGVVPGSEKVRICFSWVQMKAQSSKENSGRIKEIFEAVDIVISCPLISSNKSLIQGLCNNTFDLLLKEKSSRIIEEYKEIENYSRHVQYCFQDLVEETLYRNPDLMKKKEMVKNLFDIER